MGSRSAVDRRPSGRPAGRALDRRTASTLDAIFCPSDLDRPRTERASAARHRADRSRGGAMEAADGGPRVRLSAIDSACPCCRSPVMLLNYRSTDALALLCDPYKQAAVRISLCLSVRPSVRSVLYQSELVTRERKDAEGSYLAYKLITTVAIRVISVM